MRRRRIVAALALSLLLHAVIAWLLIVHVEPAPPLQFPPPPPSSPVLQLDIITTPPPAPKSVPNSAPVRPPTPTPPRHSQAQHPTRPGAPPAGPSSGSAHQTAPSDAPLATAPPPKLNLSPSTLPDGIAVPESNEEGSHGHTLRPGDPSLSPEAKRAEEQQRVNGRVQEFAWDGIAESRAQPGIAHPYFGQLGETMSETLERADGGTRDALGAPSVSDFMANRYAQAQSEYARTGNPGIETPGPNPRQSEILKDRYGSEGQWVQALAQATETQADLKHGAPLLALTIEVRIGAHGEYRSARILEKSKSSLFDAYVLRVLPSSLGQLPAPPDEVLHGRDEIRSVWRIEGWRQDSPAAVMGFDNVGVEGVPLPKHESNDFDFRAHLLKAYY